MSKGKAPAAPDYVGAAQLQGELSKEALNMQNYANRPTQNTPFGSTSWNTKDVVDPATGQKVTQWTQNTTLAPELQGALDAQIGLQKDRSDLASGFMDRVGSEYSKPFDWQNLPQMAQASGPGQLQSGITDYTRGITTSAGPQQNAVGGFNFGGPQMGVAQQSVQRGLSTGDNPALPTLNNDFRNQVASDLMAQMAPVQRQQQQSMETDLSNRGFKVGTAGYQRAMDELNQRQAGERYNALGMAGQEAQRLYGMQMGARQQAFNEDLSGGQFANQASGQAFNQGLQAGQFGNQAQQQLYGQMMGQADLANRASAQNFGQNLAAAQFQNQALGQAQGLDLSRMQAGNQAAQQQFNMNQSYANQQNQLRQQAIAEQMQRRGMSLNEMNALLTGQQVGMPQMPNFSQSGRAETPNILGATQMGYNAAMDQYNAQQAGFGNAMGGLFSLGSAAISNPFMFSDRRLKRRIKRVGTHALGVGIYEFDMAGYRQRGVIAQEVAAVRPELVKRHASGYLTVNYSAL
jgi:hypothetical protein